MRYGSEEWMKEEEWVTKLKRRNDRWLGYQAQDVALLNQQQHVQQRHRLTNVHAHDHVRAHGQRRAIFIH